MFNISQKSNVRQIKVYESNILLRKKYLRIRGTLKTWLFSLFLNWKGASLKKKMFVPAQIL